jgi:hypothetical protein
MRGPDQGIKVLLREGGRMVLRKEVVAFFASLSTGWESIFKGSWYREGMFWLRSPTIKVFLFGNYRTSRGGFPTIVNALIKR